MSTRCQVQLIDIWGEEEKKHQSVGAMLYHHMDGYPEFMGPYLEKMLKAIYEFLEKAGYPYWWDSERVAACMVLFSAMDYDKPVLPEKRKIEEDQINKQFGKRKYFNSGVPYFQPSQELHSDIEYLWKIILLEKGEFEIKCHPVRFNLQDEIKIETEIDWKEDIKEK